MCCSICLGYKSNYANKRNPQTYMTTYIDEDSRPSIRAIVIENKDAMLDYLNIYRDPDTRFHVRTWSGECVLTPLALAVEIARVDFDNVLSVLVYNAGIDLNEPYVIDDFKKGLRIRTNALTHLVTRWERIKWPECRTKVLHTLLKYGADAMAPALYEVIPLFEGGTISKRQGMLCAGSGQSLMSFQMSMPLDVPPPENFITDLIMMGNARFLPSDPDGLFVKWALQNTGGHDPAWEVEFMRDFLCPGQIAHKYRPIAGGLLAAEEKASGELRRLVCSFDSVSKMNILHLFVAYAHFFNEGEIVELFRMLRHVYGLSMLTHTQDGRSVRALAAESDIRFSEPMRAAVDMAVEEELQDQRRALVTARMLQRLPLSVIEEQIEPLTGLPLVRAERINQRIDRARQSQLLNFTKSRFQYEDK